ncbi:MAG: PQQ-binding-like beta-propeller repeat protein [Phycisphaerae bacterium]|nr:PQQ-binding-like beta-propeller repeat protein [Phycisphaerae bacterium]
MRAIATLLLLVVIIFGTSVCSGADWPQFRGPYRDGRAALESDLLEKWPDDGPAMLWSFDGLGRGFASVSVVDGIIYTTGMIDKRGWLFAIDTNGKLKWKEEYGPEWSGSHPGTRTTPTVDEGRLYIMSGRGEIACFSRDKGGLIWKVDTLEKFQGKNIKWGIAESVLIDGDKVFCTPGGKDATMVALNKHTGQTIWTTKGLSNLSAYCSPILFGKLLFTMVEKLIVCVDSESGKVLWTIPHETRNDIAAVTPLRYCGSRVYFTSHVTGGAMIRYLQDGGGYTELWSSQALDCLHGGVVWLTRPRPNLYGSDSKGNWVCQNISTGEVTFEEKMLDAKGSITYADDMLYCYSEKGTLGLAKPTEDGMELVSSFKITEGTGEHWAYPVVCNGHLYIRHGGVLMAFDIEKK